jgi:hypothetical protein
MQIQYFQKEIIRLDDLCRFEECLEELVDLLRFLESEFL